jgi:hypothetical protein
MRNGYSVAMHAIGALTLFSGLLVGVLLITRTAVLCVATHAAYVNCAAGERPYLTAGIVVIVGASIVAVLCFAVGTLYSTVSELRKQVSP